MQKRKFNECNLATNSLMHRFISMIIQFGLFFGSILLLFITSIMVSAGWGMTCFTYFSITSKYPNIDSGFHCNGPQYTAISGSGPFPPNGAEFITAAVSH